MNSFDVQSREVPVAPGHVTASSEGQLGVRVHGLRFTGSANEYFRVWIVNVFLTVLTLGIYGAWAKVRTRKYFYANTLLDGQSFDYHGDPVSILKGNMLVGGLFLAYSLTSQFMPVLAPVALVVFYVAYPYLIFQSLRFLAKNSSYRNIRFRFHGSLGQAYVTHLLLMLAIPFTLGLAAPYVFFRQREYLMGNAAYGSARVQFRGESGPFYRTYLVAFGVLLVAMLGFVGLIFVVVSQMFNSGGVPSRAGDPQAYFLMLLPAYGLLLLVSILVQQYIYANIANYSFSVSEIPGQLRIRSDINAWALVRIQLINILAMVCTLGLAAPWAKVRTLEYTLRHVRVVSQGSLDAFSADLGNDGDGALGDAATDFFNINIGL